MLVKKSKLLKLVDKDTMLLKTNMKRCNLKIILRTSNNRLMREKQFFMKIIILMNKITNTRNVRIKIATK